jgi:hypothetical protein
MGLKAGDNITLVVKQRLVDRFVVSLELKAPGGNPLAFEKVVVVHRKTKRPVGDPVTTDGDGKVSVEVPKDAKYDVKIVEDEAEHHEVSSDDHDTTAHLHCQFFDANEQPLVGETVKISGKGTSFEVVTGEQGEIDVPTEPGDYNLEVKGEKFKAHTLYVKDFNHEHGGQHHQFVLEGEEDDDWSKHEKARLDRYSPSDREDD